MKEFFVDSKRKEEVLDITGMVSEIVRDFSVGEGVCTVYVPHATAAVTVNENADSNIGLDLVDALNKLVPEGVWRHDRVDSNGSAHIKAAVIGPSVSIPVKDSELQMGTWQDIFLCDFDGPRKRRVLVIIR